MEIEITPKIAAWIRAATADAGVSSPAGAIELLIDATIDSDTGLPMGQLREAIEAGVESGGLNGDARKAVASIFAAARRRHGID
jgi:hypothetical protein